MATLGINVTIININLFTIRSSPKNQSHVITANNSSTVATQRSKTHEFGGRSQKPYKVILSKMARKVPSDGLQINRVAKILLMNYL